MSTDPTWANPAFAFLRCFACEAPHNRGALQTVCRACGLPLRVDYAGPCPACPA